MADNTTPEPRLPDPQQLAEQWQEISERSQRLVQDFMERQSQGNVPGVSVDPSGLAKSFGELAMQMAREPQRLVEQQMRFMQSYMELWQNTTARMMGQEAAPVVEPQRGDRRFKDLDWQENPYFDHIKQSYLLASQFILDAVKGIWCSASYFGVGIGVGV